MPPDDPPTPSPLLPLSAAAIPPDRANPAPAPVPAEPPPPEPPPADTPPPEPPPVKPGVRRFSAAHFLGAIILLFISSPFLEAVEFGRRIETVLMTLVLALAVLAVGGSRPSLILSGLLLVPALVSRWAEEFVPGIVPMWVLHGSVIIFVAFVIGRMLFYILRSAAVNSEVLCAGIGTYLLIALLWAILYAMLESVNPGSFTFTVGHPDQQQMKGFTSLYFSFVVLSTVGFGDIIPTSPVARMITMTEATLGMFYITILIARLVSMYSLGTAASPQENK